MRSCGDCQVCCVVADIRDVHVSSPAGTPCVHQAPGIGCKIHNDPTRPAICGDFGCGWYRGIGTEEHRPDLIGVMFSVNRTPLGHIGLAIEARPGALLSSAREMACTFVRTTNLPLVVVKHGAVPPHDVGDWLVIQRIHVLKAFAMRGPFIENLADDVLVYEYAYRKAA